MTMGKNNMKVKLDDDLLDKVSGGDSLWGTATGITCTQCGFEGPHNAEIKYDRVDNVITYRDTVVHCGRCGAIL